MVLKKILYIVRDGKISGSQQVVLNICNFLKSDNNFKADLIVGGDKIDNDFFREFSSVVENIYHVPSLKRSIGKHDFKALISIIKIINKTKPDIIHTHSTKPGIIGRLAGYFSGYKTIHTVHGISYHKAQSVIKRLVYYLIEIIPTLIGTKLTLVNKYYGKYYRFLPRKKLSVIYNGVDTEDKSYKRKCEPDGQIKLGFVGRLEHQKNPLFLVDIANELRKNGIDFHLEIYGEGNLQAALEEKLKESNLSDLVRLNGWETDKDIIFTSFDILLAPSNFEAFGLIFVEAASYGVPSIASSVEGIPEVISNGINGELVSTFSSKAYVDGILKMSNGYSTYQKSLFIMLSRFSLNKMNTKYIRLYEEVLNER